MSIEQNIDLTREEVLAQLMLKKGKELEESKSLNRSPLSLSQQRLWVQHHLDGGSPAYNIPSALRIKGDLNVIALENALTKIIERHEILRTVFREQEGVPYQEVLDVVDCVLETVELPELSEDKIFEKYTEFTNVESSKLFDLTKDMPIRTCLVKAKINDYLLVTTMHHIVSDGWSVGIFVKELMYLYQSQLDNSNASLDDLEIQYSDYALWQQEQLEKSSIDNDIKYWKDNLRGYQTLELPLDYQRPQEACYDGDYVNVSINKDQLTYLRKISKENGTTLFITVLAIFNVLLYRYTGNNDICIGTPTTNRDEEELEALIGFFGNILTIRNKITNNPDFVTFLKSVHEQAIQAYGYQHVPFEKVVDSLNVSRDNSLSPIFQVFFGLQKSPIENLQLSNATLSVLPISTKTSKYDLTLELLERTDELQGVFEYKTSIFKRSTVERMVKCFQRLIDGIRNNPNQSITEIEILSAEEKLKYHKICNTRKTSYINNLSIQSMFELQVLEHGDKIAASFCNETINYRSLNQKANQFAHYLKDKGVKQNEFVGLSVAPSLDLIVMILGVLKAGAAYLPIDPKNPLSRMQYICEDSCATLIITDNENLRLGEYIEHVLWAKIFSKLANYSDVNPVIELHLASPAYAIYTSGSTGKPKGVLVTHNNVIRLFKSIKEKMTFDSNDTWTLFHSYSFDFSVWEIFGGLLFGGKVVIVPVDTTRTPELLLQLLLQESVTVLSQTPSAFYQLIEADKMSLVPLSKLRYVVFGGEKLEFRKLKTWLEAHPLSQTKLINMYGITETTVHVTYKELTENDITSSKYSVIGKPLADLSLYIMDESLGLVPIGVTGELYVGGDGVSLGYVKQPALTAQRFIPDPFSTGKRLYKTGDKACITEDGEIVYRGRLDQQVKVRGFRIELDEINSILKKHQLVTDVVSVIKQDDLGNNGIISCVKLNRKNMPQIDSYQRHILPNGMAIAHFNRNETDFLYKEIYEDSTYSKNNILINDGDCIMDVGANIGMFSLFLANKYKNVKVFAFEPIPPLSKVLGVNLELYAPAVTLCDYGLSSDNKLVEFNFYQNNTIMSGCYTDEEGDKKVVTKFAENGGELSNDEINNMMAGRFDAKTYKCKLRRLSDVIDEHSIRKIDLLKIDVEKSEKDVLDGIRDDHWEIISQVVIEVHDINNRLDTIKSLLSMHGFTMIVEQDSLLEGTGLFNIYATRSQQQKYISQINEDNSYVNQAQLLQEVELLEFVKKRLPDYMIPGAFVFVEEFPLTANGKIDINSIVKARNNKPISDISLSCPRTHSEEIVLRLYKELLGDMNATINSDFFTSGGDSILAVQFGFRAREIFGVEITALDLFEAPTVVAIAQHVDSMKSINTVRKINPIVAHSDYDAIPLSGSQLRLWFIDQISNNKAVYNMPFCLRVKGLINFDVLNRVLEKIVQRHEILRTTFELIDGKPSQKIHAPYKGADILQVTNAEIIQGSEDNSVEGWVDESVHREFDLTLLPLFRVEAMRLKQDEYFLVINMHHIISDGWSINVLLREIQFYYASIIENSLSELPELPVQFKDYAVWQNNKLTVDLVSKQLNYWLEELKEAPKLLSLPLDKMRPAEQRFFGERKSIKINDNICEKLKKFSADHSVTLHVTLLTAFMLLMYRQSGQKDICIGTPSANRSHNELENLIGFFANILVIRGKISPQQTFIELLQQIKHKNLKALTNQDVSFEQLIEALQPDRDMSYSPLVQVMFVMQNAKSETLQIPGVEIFQEDMSFKTSKFDLTLSVVEDAGLTINLEYDCALFLPSTMEHYLKRYEHVLNEVLDDADRALEYFNCIPSNEYKQIVFDNNTTDQLFSDREQCVHKLFKHQAKKHNPKAIAVKSSTVSMSYEQLDNSADDLAVILQQYGVCSESLVGVCIERSIDMIVSILAIMKAGGGYVPIDPDYPESRINNIIDDANLALILSKQKYKTLFSGVKSEVLCLDMALPKVAKNSMLVDPGVSMDNLAYVIYTSGSTGTPKGVMVQHRSLSNLVLAQIKLFDIGPTNNIIQFSSMSFDASVSEIFTSLLSGATLHLPEISQNEIISDLSRYIKTENIDRMTLPPTVLRHLKESDLPKNCTIVSAGELCDQMIVNKWRVGRRFINAYGPTESTVCTTAWVCSEQHECDITPIGQPIANIKTYILNDSLNVVPKGAVGELYIGGAGLARGYYSKAGLTAEKFIPNKFSRAKGERLYKTGDLVRSIDDGNIEFIGRVDTQIKLRGYRIELGEIESNLVKHADVESAVCLVQTTSIGNEILVAFVVPVEFAILVSDDLTEHLKAYLPSYMLPSVIVCLDALPLNHNGKVDRSNLPGVFSDGQSHEEFVGPSTLMEEKVGMMVSEILGLKQVSMTNNFFELGGHSLLATELINKIREELHVEVPIREIFTQKNISDLAEMIVNYQLQGVNDIDVLELLEDLDGLSEDEIDYLLKNETEDIS